jgi:hypothetical protein
MERSGGVGYGGDGKRRHGRSGEGGGCGKTWTGTVWSSRHGLISIIHLLFFLWLKKITSTKKQPLLDEELKLKMLAKS